MKNRSEQPSTAISRPNYAVLILVAAAALCFGITSTMWWMENRPKPPATTPPPMAMQPAATGGGDHLPPSSITAGLQPPQAAVMLGNWYYDHERWPLAVQHYQEAIKLGVDNPNVRTDLGNALRFSDKPQQALQQYQTAQKLDPKHEQSLFNQGALWAMSLNQPAKGIEVWQTYLKRFPNGASADAARQLITKFSGANKAAGTKAN